MKDWSRRGGARRAPRWLAAVFMVASCGAQAALVDRGGGMIYDSDRNITWLADWNYAQTSGFDADGRMTWGNARNWANTLVFGGFDDWRLPTSLNQDGTGPCGTGIAEAFNCTDSEMGHMFYTEWGGSEHQFPPDSANLALFTNIQRNFYWSSTVYALDTTRAWSFSMGGNQSVGNKTLGLYAVAVRDGDVTAVPEPSSFALMVAGLGALGFVARRRRRR